MSGGLCAIYISPHTCKPHAGAFIFWYCVTIHNAEARLEVRLLNEAGFLGYLIVTIINW